MREHLGEEFNGTVSAVAGFGLFVTLDALYVEGLVHITELGGEYYRFDELRQELRGERTGMRYAVGARVRVQVSRVDLDGRKIDFRMVREGDRSPAARVASARVRPVATEELAPCAGRPGLQGRPRARKGKGRQRQEPGGAGAPIGQAGGQETGAEAARPALIRLLQLGRRPFRWCGHRREWPPPGRRPAAACPDPARPGVAIGCMAVLPGCCCGHVMARRLRAAVPTGRPPSPPARHRCRRWPAPRCRSG
jgi:predicted RNA-binding protein with RPS1 domain